jgi:hypothetical protein
MARVGDGLPLQQEADHDEQEAVVLRVGARPYGRLVARVPARAASCSTARRWRSARTRRR